MRLCLDKSRTLGRSRTHPADCMRISSFGLLQFVVHPLLNDAHARRRGHVLPMDVSSPEEEYQWNVHRQSQKTYHHHSTILSMVDPLATALHLAARLKLT